MSSEEKVDLAIDVDPEVSPRPKDSEIHAGSVGAINASGHVQELQRNFGFWSITSVGVVTGSVWVRILDSS